MPAGASRIPGSGCPGSWHGSRRSAPRRSLAHGARRKPGTGTTPSPAVGLYPTSASRAPLPEGSRLALDHAQHAFDDFLDREPAGVDDHRVRSRRQRGALPRPIAPVADFQLTLRLRQVRRLPRAHELRMTPPRPLRRGGLQKELHGRLREDPSPHVPAFRDDAPDACLASEVLLDRQQPGPHIGQGGHLGSRAADLRRAQLVLEDLAVHFNNHPATDGGRHLQRGRRAEPTYRIRSRRVGASAQGLPRDGAIEGAGIQVRVAESCGDQLGDGTFANPGRAVDGNDHRRGSGSPCRGLCVPRSRYCIHPCPEGVNNPLNFLSNPGNEVATQAVSSTRISLCAAEPETIMAIATRWSPWLWQTAPFKGRPPTMRRPSGRSSTVTPRRRNSVAMVAIRSLSFTRSSSAPLTMVSPWAQAAATQRIGNSSIVLGIRSGPIVNPCRGAERTRRSATGSPACTRGFRSSMRAPISCRTSRTPFRVGLTPTPVIVTSDSETSEAATRKKAAAERSPATVMSLAANAR